MEIRSSRNQTAPPCCPRSCVYQGADLTARAPPASPCRREEAWASCECMRQMGCVQVYVHNCGQSRHLSSRALSPHLAPEGAATVTRRATSPSRTQTESRSGSSRTTDPARQVGVWGQGRGQQDRFGSMIHKLYLPNGRPRLLPLSPFPPPRLPPPPITTCCRCPG